MKLSQNTILITGGTSGIGLELASQLSSLGNTVIVTGRDQAKLDQARSLSPALHTIQSDVSDPAAIARLYETVTREFPDLNVLINNAGVMRKLNFRNSPSDIEDIGQEIDVNLRGPILMVQAFLPHLKRKSAAAIVNVSSGLAFVPFPAAPVYSATKAAIHSFTVALRVQLATTPVKVFELAAPATDTPLNDPWADDLKGTPLMSVKTLVSEAVKGLERDRFEIRPGMTRMLAFLSRFAPGLALRLVSANLDTVLARG